MNKKMRLLENWIYGLLGYEEQTFMIARNLTKDLTDNGRTGFKSELVDYPDGEKYVFELSLKKVPRKPVMVKINGDLDKELKDIIERNHCRCDFEEVK